MDDLNPQLSATIQSEFEKAEGRSIPQPTRSSADLANLSDVPGPSQGGSADPLDELFPRVELDKLINGTTVLAWKRGRSESWKTDPKVREPMLTHPPLRLETRRLT